MGGSRGRIITLGEGGGITEKGRRLTRRKGKQGDRGEKKRRNRQEVGYIFY